MYIHIIQGVTLEDFPKKNDLRKQLQNDPGPLGEDPGLSRPVEMHSSRRETPSSALTASNGRPKIRNILLIKASYQNFQWKIGPLGGSTPTRLCPTMRRGTVVIVHT